MERRGYSQKKVAENVEAELIGVISALTENRFGRRKVFEFDTTRVGPKSASDSIARLAVGRQPWKAPIDWTLDYDSASKLRSLLEPPRAGSART